MIRFHWLTDWFARFRAANEFPDADSFEGYIDHVPEPPATPWHVTMPSKYRPIIVSSHATAEAAVFEAAIEAATFATEGWFVNRAGERLWHLCGEDTDGGFVFTKLEVLSGEQIAQQPRFNAGSQ